MLMTAALASRARMAGLARSDASIAESSDTLFTLQIYPVPVQSSAE